MNAARLRELRARFVARSMVDRELLLRAVDAKFPDLPTISGVAHRLAGGGGTLGVPVISAAAAVLEDACDDGDVDGVRAAAVALAAVIANEAVTPGS